MFCAEDATTAKLAATAVEAQAVGQEAREDDKAVTTAMASNSDMLEHLVTEAVKKVLADREAGAEKLSRNIVSRVVEELKPTLASGSNAAATTATTIRDSVAPNAIGKHVAVPIPIAKPVACVYNPTPIAELKKRHIPVVSYMPTRGNRVAVKRKSSPITAKPWLSIIGESNRICQSEVTYKPTAIVNNTSTDDVKDTVQTYIPTVKLDLYDDERNSIDYQSKFKEAYYPKSKKRREEYVPKKIKTPLQTTSQPLIDADGGAIIDRFESEFDTILSGDRSTTDLPVPVPAIAPDESSQDYSLDDEAKFSDDDVVENVSKDEEDANIDKIDERTNELDEKEKENLQCAKFDAVDKRKSSIRDGINSNCNAKMADDTTKSSDKLKEREGSNASARSSEKRRDEEKEYCTNKEKDVHKSGNNERDKGDRSSEGKDKERSKHKSDYRDKHRSSSSRHKDKRKSHDGKDSSHKSSSRKHSKGEDRSTRSRKDRHISSKRNRDHDRLGQDGKHRSKTSSKSDKEVTTRSRKSTDKHCPKSRSGTSSSGKQTDNDSERNLLSDDGSEYSPANTHSFIDSEIFDLSDSDHDVQEECLKIFHVSNLHYFYVNKKKCTLIIRNIIDK